MVQRKEHGMGRNAKDSLCYRHSDSGCRSFHKCNTLASCAGRCFVDDEVASARLTLPIGQQHLFTQYIKSVACAAARGDLDVGEDRIVPSATQPDIWELRLPFQMKDKKQQYRMYYAEDEGSNPPMVAMLFHLKETEELTVEEQDKRQNKRMHEAQERWKLYRDIQWGHSEQNCINCFKERKMR